MGDSAGEDELGKVARARKLAKQYLAKHYQLLEGVGADPNFLSALKALIDRADAPDDNALKSMSLDELQEFVLSTDVRVADLRRAAEVRLAATAVLQNANATKSELRTKLLAAIESMRSHEIILRQADATTSPPSIDQ